MTAKYNLVVSTRKSLLFPKINRKQRTIRDGQTGIEKQTDKLKFDAQFYLGTYTCIKNELYLE